MKKQNKFDTTLLFVKKERNPDLYNKLIEYSKDKENVRNPLWDIGLIKKLKAQREILFQVDNGEVLSTPIEGGNPRIVRILEEEGEVVLAVPDTFKITTQIKKDFEGKEIKWLNTMGLWTLSMRRLVNNENGKKDDAQPKDDSK